VHSRRGVSLQHRAIDATAQAPVHAPADHGSNERAEFGAQPVNPDAQQFGLVHQPDAAISDVSRQLYSTRF
jgi:hypothetical protein